MALIKLTSNSFQDKTVYVDADQVVAITSFGKGCCVFTTNNHEKAQRIFVEENADLVTKLLHAARQEQRT